jgi:hypothetical protein
MQRQAGRRTCAYWQTRASVLCLTPKPLRSEFIWTGNTSLFPAGRTWERELELTRNHRLNHGPIGLHFDLFDNMSDVNDASLYPLFKEKKQFRKSGGLKI